MSEEVFPNVFRIEVPLPNNPLRAVNCYVVRGGERDLIVDTGMNRSECMSAMEEGLRELDVSLDKCDFFITHLHADHMGLLPKLLTPDATVYFNEIEAKMMERSHIGDGFETRIKAFAYIAGFSEPEVEESLSQHPGLKYHANDPVDYTLLDEGDHLKVGEFDFECIHTPGHSPGHLMLFDAEKKLTLCGDHVLARISPNISAWAVDENPLDEFMVSLDKVSKLDVDLALPGHRVLMDDFTGRVQELTDHHHTRLDEVMNILDGATMTAYETASKMTWYMKAETWDSVGIMQKWFATGEAAAHLYYLQAQGHVSSEIQDGVGQFKRT